MRRWPSRQLTFIKSVEAICGALMVGLIIAVLRVYELLIIVRVVLSWMPVDPRQSWVRLLESVTEPVLAPLRPLARLGNFDLSPVVVIVLIQIVIALIR